MKRYRYVILAAVVLLMPLSARAQFRGDVFFANPSYGCPPAALQCWKSKCFPGPMLWAPLTSISSLTRHEPRLSRWNRGPHPSWWTALPSANWPEAIGIVTLNGKSLLQPFGTVSLARVRVKPLVAAGEQGDVEHTGAFTGVSEQYRVPEFSRVRR